MVSTCRPTRRSPSASVRTVVVLPVPPFSDRTAIVSAAIAAVRLLAQRGGFGGPRGQNGVDEIERVSTDGDLVSVGQGAPLDAAPIDLDAVERAVVEDAYAALLARDQGMPTRDRRVVEADVGGQGPADARPFAADRDHHHAVVLLEREVPAGAGQARLRLREPPGRLTSRGWGGQRAR